MTMHPEADFFRNLFGDCLEEGRLIELRCINRHNDQRGQQFFPSVEEFLKATHHQEKGFDSYFGVHPRDSRNGTSKAVSRVTCVSGDVDWANFDGGKEEAIKQLRDFPLSPTAVIHSGHGLQPYWYFKEPEELEDPETFRRIVQGVQRIIGSDKVHDLPRVLRVLGTSNYKFLGAVVDCRIVFSDYSRRYVISDFEPFAISPEGDSESHRVAPQIEEEIAQGSRNRDLASAAGSMRRRGMVEDEIDAALQVMNKNRCRPSLSNTEVRSIAASVGRYPPGPDVVTSPGTHPTSSITAIFAAIGFDELSEDSSADDIESMIRNLNQHLNGADGLRRMTVLEEASKRLSKNRVVQAPKALLRAGLEVQKSGSGRVSEGQKVEPWPEPVDGAALLNEIVDLIENYFVLPPKAASLLALWILGTWLYELFFIFPYLAIHSPLMRCGKSNLLAAVGALAKGSLKADDITQAVLVRCVEQFKPTLLLDELDQAGLRQNPDLRAILNAGYRADGQAARAVPAKDGDYEVKFFNVYCPKGLAGIGNFLPPTISDRSIHIFMTRKTKQEKVTRWSMKKVQSECEPVKRQLARWSEDSREILDHTPEPRLLEELDDRQWDNWEPLIKIADLVGGEWPETARYAAKTFSKVAEDDNVRVELLIDIKAIFDDSGADRLSSKEICEALEKMEHRKWPEWRNGKPLTKTQMASLLRPFGIRPKSIRIGDKTPRGYELKDLRDTFTRYIPSSDPQQVQQTSNDAGSSHLDEVQHDPQCCTSKNAENPDDQTIVADVAQEKGGSEELHKTEDGYEVYK